jgi:predicted O-methyltransferase YrrM
MAVAEDYTAPLRSYVAALFGGEDAVLRGIREATVAGGLPQIEVGVDEGRFLMAAARAAGARRALEIGTLAGYSATWIARGLVPGGRLITLEANPRHAALARQLLSGAGLGGVVDVRLGAALDTLANLRAEGPFDFFFIDADKESYPAYLDACLALARPGAVITAHNVFLGGEIVAPGDARVEAVRAFNTRLATDPRLTATILPLRDGLSYAVVGDPAAVGGSGTP